MSFIKKKEMTLINITNINSPDLSFCTVKIHLYGSSGVTVCTNTLSPSLRVDWFDAGADGWRGVV